MNELMHRRRAMMLSKAETPTEYVQDGLVLWLDGINKGNNANAWTDLITGTVFSSTVPPTFNHDNVQFTGTDQALAASLPPTVDQNVDVGTIEVVCGVIESSSTVATIYQPAVLEKLSFSFYKNPSMSIIYNSSSGDIRRPIVLSPHTSGSFSMSDAMQCRNGIQLSLGSDNHLTGANGVAYVGKRASNSAANYYGKVYCIRLYNRNLTRKEVLANYAVDRQRFSLFQN